MRTRICSVLFLALLCISAPLYAVDDDPAEVLVVETIVGARHGLKLVAPGTNTPNSIGGFDGITANTEKFSVTDENYDATLTVKKLIAYCNSVAGYDILLSASAMVSASVSHIITYSATAGGATVTTAADGTETAATNKVTEKTSLDRIDFYGADITITVNETDYLSAVTSTYAGTIKITLISN